MRVLLARAACHAQLDVARGPLADAPLVEHIECTLVVFGMQQRRIVLAQQFFPFVAQHLAGAVVDISEAALVTEHVDHVGRGIHQIAVFFFRQRERRHHATVGLLQVALSERIVHRAQQFFAAEWLAQVIVSAALQGPDGRIDADGAADNDDVGLDVVLVDEVHDLVAVDIHHQEVKQHQVEALLCQARQCFVAAGSCTDGVTAAFEHFLQ